MHGQTYRREPSHNKRTKYYMNLGLLNHGFRATTSWWLRKMLKVSTWSFHAGDRLLEPDFLPPHLTGAVCHDFLWNLLQKLLQDVDMQRCSTAFSCSSGISWTTRMRNNGLKKKVAQQHGLLFPDLFPLHFYLWGHLKSTVHDTEVSDVQDLQRRIQNGSQAIRCTPGIMQRIRQSLFWCATSCVEA
jgi:hypothetical protein